MILGRAFEKIKRLVMYSGFEFGGLNIANIRKMQPSVYLYGGQKIMFLEELGGIIVFRCDIRHIIPNINCTE